MFISYSDPLCYRCGFFLLRLFSLMWSSSSTKSSIATRLFPLTMTPLATILFSPMRFSLPMRLLSLTGSSSSSRLFSLSGSHDVVDVFFSELQFELPRTSCKMEHQVSSCFVIHQASYQASSLSTKCISLSFKMH